MYKIHERYSLSEHRELMRRAGLLTGICFCLWRASFLIYRLTDEDRESIQLFDHQKSLLMLLARDNAIGFPQDKATKDWMGGFYVNSALHRFQQYNEEFCSEDEFENWSKIDSHGGPQRALNKNYEAMVELLSQYILELQKRCEDLAC